MLVGEVMKEQQSSSSSSTMESDKGKGVRLEIYRLREKGKGVRVEAV